MSTLMFFLIAVAVGGVVNLLVITVHAWQLAIVSPWDDWVDDRVDMAKEYEQL
jgi:hypothetical protein